MVIAMVHLSIQMIKDTYSSCAWWSLSCVAQYKASERRQRSFLMKNV